MIKKECLSLRFKILDITTKPIEFVLKDSVGLGKFATGEKSPHGSIPRTPTFAVKKVNIISKNQNCESMEIFEPKFATFLGIIDTNRATLSITVV